VVRKGEDQETGSSKWEYIIVMLLCEVGGATAIGGGP